MSQNYPSHKSRLGFNKSKGMHQIFGLLVTSVFLSYMDGLALQSEKWWICSVSETGKVEILFNGG